MDRLDGYLAGCHSLLQVLEEESYGGASALIIRIYYDAFQISVTYGDQARASVFAQRGHKLRVTYKGGDSPETQRVKNLVENPAAHYNSRASMRWKTAKGLEPRGCNASKFETRLWREGR